MKGQLLLLPATSDTAKVESRPILLWGCRCVPNWVGGMWKRPVLSEQPPPEFLKNIMAAPVLHLHLPGAPLLSGVEVRFEFFIMAENPKLPTA